MTSRISLENGKSTQNGKTVVLGENEWNNAENTAEGGFNSLTLPPRDFNGNKSFLSLRKKLVYIEDSELINIISMRHE